MEKINKIKNFKIKGSKVGFAISGILLLLLFSKAQDFNWSFHNSQAVVYSIFGIITTSFLTILGPIYLIYLGFKNKDNSKNAFLIFILLIISIVQIITRIPSEPKGFSDSRHEYLQEENVSKKIQEGNKDLPMMIDSETRLDDVVFDDNTLKRYFTLVNSVKNDEYSNLFISGIKEALILNVCNEEIPQELKGYDFEFSYYDKNSELITSKLISPEKDCNLKG